MWEGQTAAGGAILGRLISQLRHNAAWHFCVELCTDGPAHTYPATIPKFFWRSFGATSFRIGRV